MAEGEAFEQVAGGRLSEPTSLVGKDSAGWTPTLLCAWRSRRA
ncbi:MAG TPA: hypothetical protein VE258_20130 [Ktedonobacterales bacterium]|nr:hypothetical protein [Ktedonobacterales bacterium]